MGGLKMGGLLAAAVTGLACADRMVERESGLLVPDERMKMGGRFHGKILRAGETVDEFDVKNIVTNEGLDYLLACAFGLVAPVAQWYLAPFTNNYSPIGTDTAASISANAGEATNYTSNSRQVYAATEAAQQVTNGASPATFTFNAAGNVYGAFLVSAGAQNATTGKLLAAAQFGGVKQVQPQDQLVLTYTFGAASA